MLTYTFSRREKVMLVILAIILVALAWYALVFQNTQNQIIAIDGQIADTQETITTETVRAAQMDSMQKTIDQQKEAGVSPVSIPDFDNMRNVMNELNVLLSGTENYSIDFDPVDSSSSLVKRGATLTFMVPSFADAQGIVAKINAGQYPCSVDSFKVSAGRTSRVSGTSNTATSVNVTMHVTFFERRAS